ncbi:Heavy metal-associated isoprenylated plant protein 26 [Apostasia shenzhenica]|uniref:Heavy metal-associated isoprenylated plant protein 26 n=1 Tax=Apostasia shenzhenica TaxID=1088818 RepID=A0A2I0A7X4_9ASPA|nr:Heavy metal-associated isoprenylated plant protein 26 [Apostasia shenzhenica]
MFNKKPRIANSATIVNLCVHMDCEGCQKKIKKALMKLDGVDDVEIDMVRQKVTVTGYVDQKKVLRAVRRTGRTAVIWPYDEYSGVESGRSYAAVDGHGHGHHRQAPRPHHHYYYSGASSSSYNYRKHGCAGDPHAHGGYYVGRRYGYSGAGEGVGSFLSDENPHACSIM